MTLRRLGVVIGLVAALGSAAPASAATLAITVVDGPGEGLNDSTPVAPVGGNSGTTLGQQRLVALQHAAALWGARLQSNVTIQVTAGFDPLSCTAGSGVLGSAGPMNAFRDFAGAPLPGTWYVSALANARTSTDLAPGTPDLDMEFNSGIGMSGCLEGNSFYLGLDGNHGNAFDLVTVVLHEIAHGLGFLTFVDGETGAELLEHPDAFESRLFDVGTDEAWTDMTDGERAVSAEHVRFVVWNGPQVTGAVPQVLATGAPVLSMTGGLGEPPVGLAQFGPPLGNPPIQTTVVAAQDSGGTSPTDGCQPVINAVGGSIALVDRGSCTFTMKVKNAQNAGAVAVIVADNMPGSPPLGLNGSDPTIVIPAVQIAQSDGIALRAALIAGSVSASLGIDPSRRVGADAENRVLLYTPSPVSPGSSLSHWDPMTTPNLLMEPGISADLTHDLDLTASLLADLGWSLIGGGPVHVPALPGAAVFFTGGAIFLLGLFAASRRGRARASD